MVCYFSLFTLITFFMSLLSTTTKPFSLLQVSGSDAKKFLQGQLTCDLEKVSTEQSQLGAHCNPQGRVLFLFRIFFQDSYYLVMPAEMVTPAITSLSKYAIFYKLELHHKDYHDSSELSERANKEWQYFDVSLGRPQIYLATSGKFLPHDLNLPELGGISWEKGCYTGQEIIARMHYRGKLKNRLSRARIETLQQPTPGMPLTGSQQSVIVDCLQEGPHSYQLLVLSHQDEVGKATLGLDPNDKNENWQWL